VTDVSTYLVLAGLTAAVLVAECWLRARVKPGFLTFGTTACITLGTALIPLGRWLMGGSTMVAVCILALVALIGLGVVVRNFAVAPPVYAALGTGLQLFVAHQFGLAVVILLAGGAAILALIGIFSGLAATDKKTEEQMMVAAWTAEQERKKGQGAFRV